MNETFKRDIVAIMLVAGLLAAGCAPTAAPPGPSPTAQTLEQAPELIDAIAATVTARVDARLAQQEPTPDIAGLHATVQQLETRLDETESLAGLVDEAVAARLGEQAADKELDLEAALMEVYRKANPAVVYIIVPFVGSGSGFVYDSAGHIVTNNHVVSGGATFEVVFAGGERVPAELIGSDTDSDLAVLHVDELPEGVEPLALAEPDNLEVGQFVVAIGNPFGEQGSMSLGIVSGLERSLRSQRTRGFASSYSLPSVIQTDAPINPGNSGGPLLNLDGQVVGINSAIASQTGFNTGVGFSVPVIALQRVVPSLIEQGRYAYSYMGASFADEISLEEQAQFGLPQTNGVYVIGVAPGGPADSAGLIGADPNNGRGGDLITAIDGKPMRNFADLNSYLAFYTIVGQTIELSVLRNEEQISVSLTLGPRP
jgi:2-alkenal reductase